MSLPDFVERSQELVSRGKFLEAVKVCRLGLLASPTNVTGRLVLGRALIALHRYDDVLAEMRVALEVDFANQTALALKGEALLRKGEVPQAVEVLKRAASVNPDDHAVLALQQEAEMAALSAPSGSAFDIEREVELAEMCEADTKHYPTHSGLDQADSGGATSPNHHVPDEGFSPLTPPPEVLAIGDSSGTIELDPEIDGVEIDPDLDDPPIGPPLSRVAGQIDQPLPPVTQPMARQPAVITQAGPAPTDPSRRPGLSGGALPFDDSFDEAAMTEVADDHTNHFHPNRDSRHDDYADEVMTGGLGRRGSSGQPRRDFDFPDDSTVARGKGRSGYGTSETRPETPRARSPHDPGREEFPRDETGMSTVELEAALEGDQVRPTSSDDMRTIRAALGVKRPRPSRNQRRGAIDDHRAEVAREAPRKAALDSPFSDMAPSPREALRARRGREPRRQSRRDKTFAVTERPRSRRLLYVYVGIAGVVVAGAIYGGLKLREMRLNRQIDSESAKAANHAREDTYAGYVKARDGYARIVKVRANAATEAALARMQAAIAAEFGEGLQVAERLVNDLGTHRSSDAMVARAFVALARSDAATAGRLAEDVVKRDPNDAYGLYLRGRAALLARNLDVAAEAFRAALRIRQRPLFYVGLGQAEFEQENYSEALAAFDRATDKAPGHPAATIHRERTLARTGKLPLEGGEPEATLETLIRSGQSVAGEVVQVSPEQVGWAALALAEVRLGRGDLVGARDAVTRAQQARAGSGWAFTRALTLLMVRTGDGKGALVEADRAARRWSEQIDTKVVLAVVALAVDDPARALAALEKAGDLSNNPEALATRGRARLAAGEVAGAAKDLDAALALRSQFRVARVARADVHLQSGNAKAAAQQLKEFYRNDSSLEMAVIYASALRRTRERDEARRILNQYLKHPNAARAYLELARLERDEGNFRKARQAYGKAIELSPNTVVARREAAILALDSGDAQGAREAFALLLKDAPDNGRVLVEAARVYCLTGGIAEVDKLLDRAEKTSSAPRWQIARERARAKLRTHAPTTAVAELERAVSLEPDDGETRLLLIDAHLILEDEEAARKVLKAVLKRFPNRPESQFALGRVNLFADRVDEAMTAFVGARKLLAKENAANRKRADAEQWIGRVYYFNDKLKSARKALGRALKLDPANSDANYYLGLVQLDLQKWKSATAAFEKAVAADPTGNPEAWFYLGEAARMARKRAVAKRGYQSYLDQVKTGDLADEARTQLRRLR